MRSPNRHYHLVAILCAALLASAVARADDPAHPACISNIRVDHTEIQDDSTILFIMRDHSVYRTTLTTRCVGLLLDPEGFTYAPSDNSDALCAEFMTIRLNTAKSICQLGSWVRVK